jgi:uncharacterized protein (DUF2062 family)
MNASRPSRLTVPRKYFRKYLPDPEAVRSSRLVAFFGPWLRHPNLWHLNRRSVSGAVAIGLFSGLVPGPLQMLTALLLAIPLKRNIPVALLFTLYTNPFTIVPLYVLAYAYGRLLLPGSQAAPPSFDMGWAELMALGKPLGVGLVALACTLALLGYAAVQLAWRAWVVSAWRSRARRRTRRA